VRNRNAEEMQYRIVGVDEVDIDRNCVSWLSPIAKALLSARLGERVRFKFPSGEEELDIVGIAYE
jgi:transcription elongation factor GreB